MRMDDEDDYSGEIIKSFNSYIPETNSASTKIIREEGSSSKLAPCVEFISLKGYPGVHNRTRIYNSWSFLNKYILDKSCDKFFGKPNVRDCNYEKGVLSCSIKESADKKSTSVDVHKNPPWKRSQSKISKYSDIYLDFDIHVQGTLLEDKITTYLTEMLNQVSLEYSLEVLFQKRIVSEVLEAKSPKNIAEVQSNRDASFHLLLESIDHLFSLVEHRSFSVNSLTIKNHYLIEDYFELFLNVIDNLTSEIAGMIGRQNNLSSFPYVFMLEDRYNNLPDQRKSRIVDTNVSKLKAVFDKVYVSNVKNSILMEPKLTAFIASNIFSSYFEDQESKFWYFFLFYN